MKASNETLRRALASATGALFELDDRGCEVACVAVVDGHARLLIAPPATPLEGTVYSTRIDDGMRCDVASTTLAGCTVEWTARAPARSVA